MKLTRRFLALLLALSMSLSMVTPAYASEAETIDETEPVVVVEETEAAAVETTEAETEAAPVVTTEAETEAPETEAPVVVETEVPVVEETEAVVETEAPVVEETEPVVIETEPAVVETEPAVVETEPAVVETEPAVVETEPVVEETEEVVMEEAAEAVNDVLSTELADNAWMESVADGSVVATYTATSDGTAKMYLDSGFEDVDIIVTDQNGKEYSLLEDGIDNYGLELQIAVKIGDVLSIKLIDAVEAPARTVGWSFVFTYPLGSEQNPIYPEWEWDEEYTVATAKIKVEKKSSAWVTVNGGDMLLTVNGETVEVVPTMNAYGFEAFNVLLENTSSKAKTFTLVQTYAEGAPENPMVLEELSYAELSLKDGDENGFYYSYTVPEDCSYTFYIGSITEGVAADITVYNENSYEFKQLTEDGVDNYGLEMTMDVKAGDLLKINVFVQGSYDENWNYIVPAADLSWNAIATYPAGSLKNPIAPEWMWNEAGTEATATVTVPAGATQWFAGGMGEIVITVNGAEVELETITNPYGMSSSVFSLTNATEADATYELDLGYAVGTRENPEILGDISKFVANLAKNDSDGRFYTYYNKAAKGTLTFKGSAKKVGFDIILSKAGDYTTYALSESENGTVSIDVAPWDQVYIQVVAEPKANWEYPAAKVTLTGTFEYPLGSQMNPDKLTFGDFRTAAIEEGNMDGYLFSWTAHMDGMLEINLSENANWIAQLNNMTAGIYGDMRFSDDGGDPYMQVSVSKGDEIQLMVNTYDPDSWVNPAGEIVVGCGFSVVDDVVSGKSLTLKFADPVTGKTVSAKKVKWEIVDVWAYNPYAWEFGEEEVHFNDVSAYATIKNGKLSTKKCGDSVYLVVLGTYNDLTIPYYIEMLPATNLLSVWAVQEIYDESGELVDTYYNPVYYQNPVLDVSGYGEENAPSITFEADCYPSNSLYEVNWKASGKLVDIEQGYDDNYGPYATITPKWDAKKGCYKTGTVTITATAADGSGKKTSFKLQIINSVHAIDVTAPAKYKVVDTIVDTFPVWNEVTGEEEWVEREVPVIEVDVTKKAQTIALKANFMPENATNKKVYWYGDPVAKISSNGKVTISKNTPDGYNVWVYAQSQEDYSIEDAIVIRVKSKATWVSGVDLRYVDEYDNWYDPDRYMPVSAMDVSAVESEEDLPVWKFTANIRLMGDDMPEEGMPAVNWSSSDESIVVVSSEVVEKEEWNEYLGQFVTYLEYCGYVIPAMDEEGNCKTGTATVTVECGGFKDSVKVKVASLVSSMEIVHKDGSKITDTILDWNNEEVPVVYITAGKSLQLKVKTNDNAANKKATFYGECEYGKVSKSGKITTSKVTPSWTYSFEVWAYSADGNAYARVMVVIVPRATNVHARMITEDGTPFYVSNTTQTVGAWEGNRIEIDALVYPFEASQDVTWKSNKTKIVKIVTEIDDEGVEHTYMEFTGKTGKVTITATADDGSKEKATFTLNVITPVVE